jgi:hypothetical protein
MEEKHINWKAIADAQPGMDRSATIRSEIERVGYVSLSDCFVNRRRASSQVLMVLDEFDKDPMRDPINRGKQTREPRMYRIKCLRRANGDEIKPGDEITWKRQVYTRANDGTNKPYTQQDVEEIRRRGMGEVLQATGRATVDDYGCITIPYRDAAQLISLNGQHYGVTDSQGKKTGVTTLREVTTRAVVINGETEYRQHRWNWLYEEVPPGTKLEKITPSKKRDKSEPQSRASVQE